MSSPLCPYQEAVVLAFHDGEPDANADTLSNHLEGCRLCRRALVEARQLDAALAAHTDTGVDEGTADRLLSFLPPAAAPAPTPRRPLAVPALVVLALVVLGLSFTLGRMKGRQEVQEAASAANAADEGALQVAEELPGLLLAEGCDPGRLKRIAPTPTEDERDRAAEAVLHRALTGAGDARWSTLQPALARLFTATGLGRRPLRDLLVLTRLADRLPPSGGQALVAFCREREDRLRPLVRRPDQLTREPGMVALLGRMGTPWAVPLLVKVPRRLQTEAVLHAREQGDRRSLSFLIALYQAGADRSSAWAWGHRHWFDWLDGPRHALLLALLEEGAVTGNRHDHRRRCADMAGRMKLTLPVKQN